MNYNDLIACVLLPDANGKRPLVVYGGYITGDDQRGEKKR
jgi:hypothetical protein